MEPETQGLPWQRGAEKPFFCIQTKHWPDCSEGVRNRHETKKLKQNLDKLGESWKALPGLSKPTEGKKTC